MLGGGRGDLDGLGCDGRGDLDGLGDLDGAELAGNLISAALCLLGVRHLWLARVLGADMLVDTAIGKHILTVRANEINDGARLLALVLQALVDVDDGGGHFRLLVNIRFFV